MTDAARGIKGPSSQAGSIVEEGKCAASTVERSQREHGTDKDLLDANVSEPPALKPSSGALPYLDAPKIGARRPFAESTADEANQSKTVPELRDFRLDKIPGTDDPWSAAGVADQLEQWLDTPLRGNTSVRALVDLTHALSLQDRIAVAEELAKRRADRDAAPCTEVAALDFLRLSVARKLDGSRSARDSAEALIIKAQLDPDNPSGQLRTHDLLVLEIKGWSKCPEAVLRLLGRCSHEQIASLDGSLRCDYEMSLDDAITQLKTLGLFSNEAERQARFLVEAPRVDGVVPLAYRLAFDLHEIAGSRIDPDLNQLFRILESLTSRELLDVAKAYQELNGSLWNDSVTGDGGESGQMRATALYHAMYDRLRAYGEANDLWFQRLALACTGLRYEPDTSTPPETQREAALAHSLNVARYLSVAFRLDASRPKSAAIQKDLPALFALIQPDPTIDQPRPPNGLPTVDEIAAWHHLQFAGHPAGIDVRHYLEKPQLLEGARLMLRTDVVGRAVRPADVLYELANVVLDGAGIDSPQAGALRIIHALDHNLIGVGKSHADVVYRVLDRPDLPVEQRQRYVAEVVAEIARRKRKPAHADAVAFVSGYLCTHLYSRQTPTAELRINGDRSIPARAVRLLENGTLTPAERLVYALYEKGPLGVFDDVNLHTVVRTLRSLSPLEKLVALTQYAEMVGKPLAFDAERGFTRNALADDLARLEHAEAGTTAVLTWILPHEVELLALQLSAYLDVPADPALDAWVQKTFGSRDQFWARLVGGQNAGAVGKQSQARERLREMVEKAGGVARFAAASAVSEQALIDALAQVVRQARGNDLAQLLMGFLGPDAARLEVYARKLGDAVHRAVLDVRTDGRARDEHIKQIRDAYSDLRLHVSHAEQLRRRIGAWGSNAIANVATSGLVATSVLGPVAVPWVGAAVLFGIGAASSTGFHLALGERRKPVLFLEGLVQGGANGLLGYFSAVEPLYLPESAALWLHMLAIAVKDAKYAVANRALDIGLDPETWKKGLGDSAS